MPVCKKNSQRLYSQLKQLRWAIATCEHPPNVLHAFGAELTPVLPSSCTPHSPLPNDSSFISTECQFSCHRNLHFRQQFPCLNTRKLCTFPLQTPYVARAPAQVKQKPGGSNNTDAPHLEKKDKDHNLLMSSWTFSLNSLPERKATALECHLQSVLSCERLHIIFFHFIAGNIICCN